MKPNRNSSVVTKAPPVSEPFSVPNAHFAGRAARLFEKIHGRRPSLAATHQAV